MNGKSWAAGAVLAIVLANTGCVSCCSTTYAAARKCGPECEVPTPCRGNVYVYMVHGAAPTDCGLEALREKIAESGFAKVGVAELPGAPCAYFDIKKQARCEPGARFVLVGQELGAAAALCLARELRKDNVPVEAVVLLDPVGCGSESCGLQTLLITSGTGYSTAPHTGRLVVADASRSKLPAHPATVGAITEVLKEIAARNCVAPADEIEEWGYPHAPEMRPVPRPDGTEWDFLAERDGVPAPLGTQATTKRVLPASAPVPAPVPAATAPAPARPSPFAGAVMLPK
jgi:hypothetical protein